MRLFIVDTCKQVDVDPRAGGVPHGALLLLTLRPMAFQ
jgi:hypothetical protein